MEASRKTRSAQASNGFFNNDNVVGYIFAAPFIISFLCLTMIPMGLSLYYSFCNYKIGALPDFIGDQNYLNLMKDATFVHSLLVTIQYVVIGVPLKLVFALFIAMLLTKPTKAQGFYRAVYYIPSLIGGSVAVALVWKQLFGSRGPIVSIIKTLGVKGFNFFGSTTWAFLPLVLCNAWQFGSSMLIFASGLKQIPKDYYEAAEIDGATGVKQFFKITIPLLSPTIFFILQTRIIGALQQFDLIYMVMDNSNRALSSVQTVVYYFYTNAFTYNNRGLGAAIVVCMLIIIMIITFILQKTEKKWVFYN